MCNDPFIPLDYMVHQHKYHSVYGRFNGTIAMSEEDRKEFFVLKQYASMSSGRRKSTGIWMYLGDEHCGPFYCDSTDSCIWLLDEKTHSSLQVVVFHREELLVRSSRWHCSSSSLLRGVGGCYPR